MVCLWPCSRQDSVKCACAINLFCDYRTMQKSCRIISKSHAKMETLSLNKSEAMSHT